MCIKSWHYRCFQGTDIPCTRCCEVNMLLISSRFHPKCRQVPDCRMIARSIAVFPSYHGLPRGAVLGWFSKYTTEQRYIAVRMRTPWGGLRRYVNLGTIEFFAVFSPFVMSTSRQFPGTKSVREKVQAQWRSIDAVAAPPVQNRPQMEQLGCVPAACLSSNIYICVSFVLVYSKGMSSQICRHVPTVYGVGPWLLRSMQRWAGGGWTRGHDKQWCFANSVSLILFETKHIRDVRTTIPAFVNVILTILVWRRQQVLILPWKIHYLLVLTNIE